ncbi:uncharacterized protein LOC132400328 [Hypanus sabinus]|uniref:uncharacterized protein LOC132400328 n=1 Tax=Hypanus sabinus TaxID=79690 RepID=UPI0028C403A5|nr:uncharacterized protein LOC132400328 [Hypanus sabinus]
MFLMELFLVAVLILQAEAENSKESSLPAPRNVHFLSVNLQNVLHWERPTRRESGKQLFSVHYKVYGEPDWKIKTECQNITRTYCDLSNETDDYKEHYYARVRSVSEAGFSNWIRSGRFNPEMETNFTSPEVKLEAGVCSISIILTPSKKWQDNHHVHSIPLTQIFHDLKFEVLVIDRKTNKSGIFLENGGIKTVDGLEHDTTYCVIAWSVEYSTGKKSDPSEIQCTTTPKDPSKQMVKIILLGCVLPIFFFIFLFVSVCCFMYKYINASDQKRPINLLQQGCPSKKTFLFLLPESLTINVMVLENGGNRASVHSCQDADDSKTPLTKQFSNESTNEWEITSLATKDEKNAYKSQIIGSPTTENHPGGKGSVVFMSDQSKQSGLSNEKKILQGDIAMENTSCSQELQNIHQLSESLQAGYKSQMPSPILINEEVQDHVEYGFLTTDTHLNPKYEPSLHSSSGEAESPQEMSYLLQPLAHDLNMKTSGNNTDWAKVGSYKAQQGRVCLSKMALEQEHINYKSQFQLQPAGQPPVDVGDHCPIVLDTNRLNQKHQKEMEEPDDWSLNNCKLTLSALCVRRDLEESGFLSETIEQQSDFLSSVCTKTSQDVYLKTEEETCLSSFQEHWGLCVQV